MFEHIGVTPGESIPIGARKLRRNDSATSVGPLGVPWVGTSLPCFSWQRVKRAEAGVDEADRLVELWQLELIANGPQRRRIGA
jgi:hypothetical protein